MGAPHIQYAKTRDGVSIAFWTLGDGLPLVHSWGVANHAELEWRFPEIRGWYERLARHWRLVGYEKRGVGLSQREVEDFSLDAHVADLEAVAERLAMDSFALFAPMISGPIAIAYAARHSDQHLRLILWNSWCRHADIAAAASIRATDALLERDWLTYAETYAHVLLGWDQGGPAHRYATMMRQSITPQTYLRRAEAMRMWDVTELLPKVRAETLVLQRSGLGWLDLSVGRHLAASIPNARFVVQDGSSVPPFLGDMEDVAQAIDGFLEEESKKPLEATYDNPSAHELPITRGSKVGTSDLRLSPRQREILGMIVGGMTNREIAVDLVLSLRTVERHVNDIYARLGVRNRAGAVALASKDPR